ncbi:MAG: polysaccharide deacetylase family protein [Bacteroidota bacterium]|nr:polysaccharide deacetylase family protein [Bacteroidota bacterium]
MKKKNPSFLKSLLILSLILIQIPFLSSAKSKIKKLPERLVVLTFDDAVSNHYSFVGPLLKEYGFGATFYICEFPPDFEKDKKQYLTWGQIKALSDMGFEIGNHTGHHTGVTELSKEDLIKELDFIDKRCIENSIPIPTTFAYPGCGVNPELLPTLKEHGIIFARTCDKRAYSPKKDDPLLIPSFPIQGTDKNLFYDAILQAKAGSPVVLLFHGIPDYAHPWVTTPPELFEEYMKYLKKNHFTVIAMRDLANYKIHD